MSSSSVRRHAGAGSASDQPAVPEPSFAERARTLVCLGRTGSLSTLSGKQPGFPFGSVMPYGLDERGRPIFLISTMAMHTQNLQADPRASLLVTQPDPSDDPLGASRVTLMGNVLPLPGSEVAETRKLYLARYANSKYWVDFEDFSFYRMEVVDPGWHAWCPHRISARGKQSHRNSKGLGRDGAAGALASVLLQELRPESLIL